MTAKFTDFAMFHLYAAQTFALRSHALEATGDRNNDGESRSCVLSSIIVSVCFLEASINQLFMFHQKLPGIDVRLLFAGIPEEIGNTLHDLWAADIDNLSILSKYNLVLAASQKEALQQDANPFQDAKALIGLRNAIVQYKEGWLADGQTHPMERKLKGKFPINALAAGHDLGFYPAECLGYGCAKWACTSAKSLVDQFYQRLAVTRPYANYVHLNVEWP